MSTKFKSPVYNVIAVPMDKIEANDYNPNHVAKREMDIVSKHQMRVTPCNCLFYDQSRDKYVIVDGFHRYTIMLRYKNILSVKTECYPYQ
jgi:hypothetical protein